MKKLANMSKKMQGKLTSVIGSQPQVAERVKTPVTEGKAHELSVAYARMGGLTTKLKRLEANYTEIVQENIKLINHAVNLEHQHTMREAEITHLRKANAELANTPAPAPVSEAFIYLNYGLCLALGFMAALFV